MKKQSFLIIFLLFTLLLPGKLLALSSVNIPLGSPIYSYIDKIAGLGLISSDFKGIRPITKSEAARLLLEAEKSSAEMAKSAFANDLMEQLRFYLRRELSLYAVPVQAPAYDIKPVADILLRYVYLDGQPRDYSRGVHDPGGEGVFGIGSGLRPVNPYPSVAQQRGTEGTPLFENNEGTRYPDGSSLDLRFSSEANFSQHVSLLVEPEFISIPGAVQGRLRKAYGKVGGGALELEAGRDSNWFGFGERGAITLSNNALNFDLLKLSSPEPIDVGIFGKLKYSVVFSRFDSVMTSIGERQPWFYAIKGSLKPIPSLEIGLNLGRQQGGPGVDSSLKDNLQGLVGGTTSDNSNSLSGLELRWRLPFLRNSEAYLEFSGEDAAKFWPFVESYLAGFYIPRVTDDGKNDFRFEYFQGNNILYTHGQFTQGYIYKGMPIGHAEGGATNDFFFSFSHWFSVRERAGADYIHTSRGNTGRLPGQVVERKNALRAFWNLPLADHLDMKLVYGLEQVNNPNLQSGSSRTNNIAAAELYYRF